MKRTLIAALGLSAVSLSACTAPLTSDQRTVAGVAGGAAAGLIAAEVLEADNEWRLIAALAGAAAGTVVAQNSATQQCAYARGDGTYYEAACP